MAWWAFLTKEASSFKSELITHCADTWGLRTASKRGGEDRGLQESGVLLQAGSMESGVPDSLAWSSCTEKLEQSRQAPASLVSPSGH